MTTPAPHPTPAAPSVRHEGDTMTAQRLRDAAKVLRERAQAATPGPWSTTAGTSGDPADGPTTYTLRAASGDIATGEYDSHDGCALDYAAIMHPGVGLALAGWLDEVAGWREEGLGFMPVSNLADAWGCIERQANVVADLILGGQS